MEGRALSPATPSTGEQPTRAGAPPAGERVILAIDASSLDDARRLAAVARDAGARFVKFGLELSSATSWADCARLAADHGLDWVADAKLHDIPNTVAGAVRNIVAVDHPPFAVTMHATSGRAAMAAAQAAAGEVAMLGVTILTSIEPAEAATLYGLRADADEPQAATRDKVLALARGASEAGLRGVVCSAREVGAIKADPATRELFAMIPGIRSASADAQDQSRAATPTAAIGDGADLLVIGRQITRAPDSAAAYAAVVREIEVAL